MRVIARMKAACPPGIPAWSPARNAAVACAATACSCTSSVLPLEVAPPFRRSLFRANRHRRISPCRPAADAKHSRLRCRRRHCPLPPRGRNAACPAFHIQKPAQIVNYFVDNSCPEFTTILSTSRCPGAEWHQKDGNGQRRQPRSSPAECALDAGATRFMAAAHLALVRSGTDDHGRHGISESRNEDERKNNFEGNAVRSCPTEQGRSALEEPAIMRWTRRE